MEIEALKQVWPEWRIGKRIGGGAYGVVYEAERSDYNVENHAAIKIISIPASESEVDTLRSEGMDLQATRTHFQAIVNDFVNEIRLMVSLDGRPNIVNVKDYRVVEKDGEFGWYIFILMELLTPFAVYTCDHKLSESEVIKLGCDICTALETCTAEKIIHRDIKPGNILIHEKTGTFKLGDFGIARKLENTTGGLSQRYTPKYMAPEVATSPYYDERVDIYSLGIVLYELLNGRRIPFQPDKQIYSLADIENAVRRRNGGESIPAPSDASPAMAEVILRACDYDPDMRFATATEMKQALMSVANGTYQIGTSGLDKTTSVRKAADSYDRTTSVRKAPAASIQKSAPAVSTFGGSSPKKKSKMPAVIAAVLAVVLLVGVGIFAVPKLLDGNDTSGETADYSEFDEEQIASILSEADALAAKEDYEGALVKVQTGLVTYPKSAELQDKEDEYTKALNAQIKGKTLAEAKSLADSGDYVSAITLIKNAQKTQDDDADYLAALTTYSSAYKTEVITSADTLSANGDHLGAIQTIEAASAVIGEDDELANEAQVYEDSYVSDVVMQIDANLVDGNFDAADQLVSETLKHFPNNTIIKEQQSRIENSRPKNLLNECPPYQTTGYHVPPTFKMAGTVYTNGFTLDCHGGSALFNLGGQYNKLEFDLGYTDSNNRADCNINIYLDGQLIKNIVIGCEDLPQHIVISLNGALQLKIENVNYGNMAVYGFANAIVYKNFAEELPDESSETLPIDNQYLLTVCPPYQTAGYHTPPTFNMAGTVYANGFTLDCHGGSALFNLNGKYSKLEFDLGYTDSNNRADCNVNIYLDGQLIENVVMGYEDLPQHIVIPLNGASQLKIENVNYGNMAVYGFANVIVHNN